MRFLCCIVLALTTAGAWAAESTRVLIVHSFGGVAPPFTTHSSAFATELIERMGERVDLDEVSLDTARFADPEMQEALVEYLLKRQAKWQPDLVVPIGSPAGIFVAQFRDRLFPQTPILYTGMDRRRLPADALQKNAAFIGENYILPGFVEDILQIAPATTNIAVVIGASALEQYWTDAFRREFEPFTNRVSFTWLNELSFDQMLERLAKLPPRSFIFIILLLRDATGVTHNADEALKRIHAVANAPINSIFQSQLGLGIVGGRLYPDEAEGIESAHIAVRLLHGEPASSFPPWIVERSKPQYDWRELQRWKIGPDRLPPGSLVKFREPTVWERYRAWIIVGSSVCAIEALFIFVLFANLIQLRRAERSLRESEERMKLAASAAELGIWEWDLVTDQIWATGAAAAELGLPDSGRADYDRFVHSVHPDDREAVAHAVAKSINGDGDYQSAHRVILPNGQLRWITARGRVEFDGKHKPLRMRGVSLDITARKQAEDHAQESERRFLLMANSAPVLIWASGPDKLCTFFNQPWLEFTGRTLEQEQGNGWAAGVHPNDLAGCLKTYAESFDARRPFTMEYRLRRHDGHYRWISDHGVPRHDAQQQFLGYIGSCVDVTERKEAEAEAQRTRLDLAHVTRVSTMGELTGSLAHELNQPLTAILSNAQAAQRLLDGDRANLQEVREILRDIVEEDRRAGEVIVRLRAMLKKEDSKFILQDLNQIVGEVLGLMHSEFVVRKVVSSARLAPGLPQVLSDRVQLQQVLLNLVVNACDAMSDNPESDRLLTIGTELVEGGLVQTAVSDRGPGFPPEALKQPFEPFRTTKPNGLGLGLPICHSIINSHGGRLWVANNSDRGATVRFTLPVRKEETPLCA